MNSKLIYTPAEANVKRLAGEVTLVDVRAKEDFDKGHIPDAVNIPEMFTTLSMSTADGLQEMQDIFVPLLRKAGIRHDQSVVVYEESLDTRYGGSCRGYFQLSVFGHRDVGILDGGLSQWLREGLPMTTDATVATPSSFEPVLQKDFIATLDDMVVAIENPQVKLLDNRDEDEWRGVSSSPYGADFAPRKGRIPGARASNTYIALKMAGFNKVRNYYGSWNEWSRHPELPIDAGVLAA